MTSANITFENTPFSRLIKESEELAQIRKEYASLSDKERMFAADYHYNASFASQLFDAALGKTSDKSSPWPCEVESLAIDPNYAPAILTVGSYEYIYGRIDEAMNLFLSLVTLPETTEDLVEIIDKAGDFLIDNKDYKNAKTLYLTAVRKHPNIPTYHSGLGYCLAKLGRLEEAVEQARCAVNLEPDNYLYLTDLGWSLVEAEHFDEAHTILERAVSISPPDYELAKGNLKELHHRLQQI